MSEWEEDSAWEGIESGTEDIRLSAKRSERKTQVQRNKIKRRKEAERQAKMAADIKRKNDQVAEHKKITKALAEKERFRSLASAAVPSDGDDSSEVCLDCAIVVEGRRDEEERGSQSSS